MKKNEKKCKENEKNGKNGKGVNWWEVIVPIISGIIKSLPNDDNTKDIGNMGFLKLFKPFKSESKK